MKPILVEVSRGDLTESIHRGSVAIADASGRLLWSIGEVERPIFGRSALKMLQAVALVESGAADAWRLAGEELALACGSHAGEPFHVATVAAWLQRIGCSAADLACGAAPGVSPRARLAHNCSGKHAGFLALARHMGVPTAGYERPEHPVQQLVLATIAEMAGVSLDAMPLAIDGCTAPAVALPLKALATAEARIADPSGLPAARAGAARRLDAAVKAHPLYVAGTGNPCSALIQAAAGRASMKTGAEGAYVAVLTDRGLGVALKIDDGAGRASETAIAAVLIALGAVDATDPSVAALVQAPIRDSTGRVVGARRPAAGFAAKLRALDRTIARARPRRRDGVEPRRGVA